MVSLLVGQQPVEVNVVHPHCQHDQLRARSVAVALDKSNLLSHIGSFTISLFVAVYVPINNPNRQPHTML